MGLDKDNGDSLPVGVTRKTHEHELGKEGAIKGLAFRELGVLLLEEVAVVIHILSFRVVLVKDSHLGPEGVQPRECL